jgi:hypothetical protein
LILFEPKPEPPVCFEEAATDVDTLLAKLEQQMVECMK